MIATSPDLQSPVRPRRIALALFGVAMLAMVVPFVPAVARVALTVFNIAVLIGYFTMRKKTGPIDYFEVILPYGALHVLYFGIGALYLSFYSQVQFSHSLEPYVTAALALGVVGFCAFLFGYAFFFSSAAPSRTQGLVPRGAAAILVPAALGFTGFLAKSLLPRFAILRELGLSEVFSLAEHLSPLFLFSWFLGWSIFWSNSRRMSNRLVILALSFLAVLVIYLTLGTKELGITVLAFPALAYGYVRHRFPWKSFVALLLVLVFIIFPLYTNFRRQEHSLGTSQRLERSIRVAARWHADEYAEQSMGAFFDRTALVTSVAAILRDTGRWVDFAKGRTLLLLPVGLLVPRFVWPDKPVLNVGKEFGETFQLVSSVDEETNVAPTMVGELYWNFQVPGVLIGMALLGAGYRWYYERYGRGHGYDPVRRAIYMAILPAALHAEGSVALTLVGIVEIVVLVSVVTFLLRRMGALVQGAVT